MKKGKETMIINMSLANWKLAKVFLQLSSFLLAQLVRAGKVGTSHGLHTVENHLTSA